MKTVFAVLSVVVAAGLTLGAQTYVDVTGAGAEKQTVSIAVSGVQAATFTKSLKRNLELSGCFVVRPSGSIKVTGNVNDEIVATGPKKLHVTTTMVANEKDARMAARLVADGLCEAFAGQKGFARDPIVFVSRKSAKSSELCMCYPDGQDIRQLTADAQAVVGPRWKDKHTVFYTGFLNGGPQIWEQNVVTGKRKSVWNFKGLSTGAVLSPDGQRVAIILSFQGNPELYVIELATRKWTRLTKTPNASEGQPSWSPDGKKIVYVSDETRHPQLYVIDVATKAKRRLTSRGSQNVDPDWGRDGRIAYITKRGGLSQVAVLEPAEGDGSARLVTAPGSWEHPSWSRDLRHLTAGRDKALFVVDTVDNGDAPVQLFFNAGTWITPSWAK